MNLLHFFWVIFRLGSTVAMFKYSPVSTCSVSLPPQMMEFSASVKREFLKKDSNDVCVFIAALSLILREFVNFINSASFKL